MDFNELSLKMHKEKHGKVETISKVPVKTREDLSTAYTPGVAAPCKEIHKDANLVYDYTIKANTVAIVSDGSAVLGLGNIGAKAAIPVMEGKAVLFKTFGGLDAFPICLDTQDPDEIVKAVKQIAPVFGGINLEDIAAPKCFYVEEECKKIMDIPVFHDDQHGTAIVVCAALLNALKVVGKKIEDVKIVQNGPGSAGTAIIKMLINLGAKHIVAVDTKGIISSKREGLNDHKKSLLTITNKEDISGNLTDAVKGADVFIGTSVAGALKVEDAKTMAKDAIVFGLANPVPEIMPDEAKAAGVRIIATGRSDFPNQVNNVLVFPGIFKGAMSVRATCINDEMKKAACYALSSEIAQNELSEENIIPPVFKEGVANRVASAVAEAAKKTGVARL